MFTELLPPDINPIAVNKYIKSKYQIIAGLGQGLLWGC